MSMTKEEAIKHLLHDWIINLGCDFAIKPGRLDDFLAALDVALSALRPVSREQVEKVWRGCEKCNGAGEYSRYAENLTKTLLAKYCPHCGRPLTDEAVDMVMERLEAVYE